MLPIAIIIAAAAVGLGLIIVAILNWDTIKDWFMGRKKLKQSDKDNVAFTLNKKLSNGKYNVVQGVFNKGTNELLDGVQYEAKEIDDKLAEVHRNEELVVYE